MKTHFYIDLIISLCDKRHLTVDQIFSEIKEKHPDVGRSSIYRNVEELVKEGTLKKVIGIGNKAYFEKNIGEHIHLIDEETGSITDLEGSNITIPGLPKNFELNNIDIKIYGKFS